MLFTKPVKTGAQSSTTFDSQSFRVLIKKCETLLIQPIISTQVAALIHGTKTDTRIGIQQSREPLKNPQNLAE